jgi:hypothetical protein
VVVRAVAGLECDRSHATGNPDVAGIGFVSDSCHWERGLL